MNTLIIAKHVIKLVAKDKKNLILLFVVPIIMVTLLNATLSVNDASLKITTSNLKGWVLSGIKDLGEITEDDDYNLEKFKVSKQTTYIYQIENEIHIIQKGFSLIEENNDLMRIMDGIKNYQDKVLSKSSIAKVIPKIENDNLTGVENIFDSIIPFFMCFFIFFLVYMLAGISFLRERVSGSLERLLLTPLKHYQLILGYLLGFGFYGLIQTLIIEGFILGILNPFNQAHFFDILLINILTSFSSLSIAIFLANFLKTEFQVMQSIPLLVTPQIFLGGLFDLRANDFLKFLSYLMPIKYPKDALNMMMIEGRSLFDKDVLFSLSMIILFIVVFFILSFKMVKK